MEGTFDRLVGYSLLPLKLSLLLTGIIMVLDMAK